VLLYPIFVRYPRYVLLLLLLVLSTVANGADQPTCPDSASQIEITSGNYSPIEGVTFVLSGFSGRMVPRDKKAPGCLMRVTQVERGRVTVTARSLTKLFQRKTKARGNLEDVQVEFKGDHVLLSGKMRNSLPVQFQVEGPISAQGDAIEMHVESIKAEKIPVKGFLNLIGENLSSIVGANSAEGISVKGDTLTFRLEAFGNISGRLKSANIGSNALNVEFQPAAASKESGD